MELHVLAIPTQLQPFCVELEIGESERFCGHRWPSYHPPPNDRRVRFPLYDNHLHGLTLI